jgi:hypothetical protein
MRQAMGQRFSDCGQGGFPAGAGMMGTLGGGVPGGMMGGDQGGYGSGGMMGGQGGYGGGGMMGFDRGSGDDDDDAPGAWMAVVFLVLLLVAGGSVLLIARRGRSRGGPAPLDVLSRRLARGEINVEDYERRRRLLEGGS